MPVMDAVALCTSIAATAREVTTCRPDCRTLARFVGKVSLILQALEGMPSSTEECAAASRAVSNAAPTAAAALGSTGAAATSCLAAAAAAGEETPHWGELLSDIKEALWGCAELMQGCSSMGRLEAVLRSEEMRTRFDAAAADLALAVAGLTGVKESAPEDVGEDIVSLCSQLNRLRFTCHGWQDQLAAELLRAVTLMAAGVASAGRAGGSTPGLAPACCGGTAPASTVAHTAALLAQALSAAGLDASAPAGWLDYEVRRLQLAAKAAQDEEDWIGAFFNKQILMCLLVHVLGAWDWVSQQLTLTDGGGSGSSSGTPVSVADATLALSGSSTLPSSVGSGASGAATAPAGVDAAPSTAADKENGRQLRISTEVTCSSPRPSAGALSPSAAGQCQGQGEEGLVSQAVLQLVTAWFSRGGRAGLPPATPLALTCSLSLAEETVAALCSMFGAECAETPTALKTLDPQNMNSVVAGLSSPTLLTQLMAAVVVEHTSEEGGEAGRAQLVSLKAIPALLRLLQAGGSSNGGTSAGSKHPALRRAVATAFRHLARDPGTRKRIAESGAIPPLVALLQNPSGCTRQAAARALSNLVVNSSENKLEAAKFGAVHSLVKMLGPDDSQHSREAAAAALGNLAANSEEAQALIADAGAIPLLTAVLGGASSSAARQHAARALRNLAGRDNRNKIKAAEAGAIELLVDLLQQADDAASRQAAASALSNIACNCEETQKRIAEAGAVPVLCTLLECGCSSGGSGLGTGSGLGSGSGSAISDGAVSGVSLQPQQSAAAAVAAAGTLAAQRDHTLGCREAAAWTLSNLACSAEVRHAIAKHEAALIRSSSSSSSGSGSKGGVVAGLVELLRAGSDSGRQAAARAIKNLAAGHSNSYKARIAESGAIPPLVDLLLSPTDATRKAAASALWNLAYRNNANRAAITQCGAIPRLVRLLRPEANSQGCRQEAARALSNLSCNNDANQGLEMANCGAIPLLVSMMQGGSPAAREAAAGAISNLACIKPNQGAIMEAGAVPMMLALLQPGSSSGCQEAAARGFGNLICDNLTDELRASASQAAPLLVGVVAGGSDGARQAAARALSNLACSDSSMQALVARSGAPAALVGLCQSPAEELREAAATALWDIAYDSSLGRGAVAAAGAVPWLTQLLLFGGSGAKEAAAATLAELAAVGPAVQQEIRAAGAVQLLQQLSRGDNAEVALAATEALRSLEVNQRRSLDQDRERSSGPPSGASTIHVLNSAATAATVSVGQGLVGTTEAVAASVSAGLAATVAAAATLQQTVADFAQRAVD